MQKKKPVSKKSLEYVRPQPGSFTLERFPGHEFKFRLITVDDEAYCLEKFGKPFWAILKSETAQSADLCKLWFHFLSDDDKAKFKPVKKMETDYETGEEKEVTISGPRLFMQSIDGGSLTEVMLISHAFLQTVIASRPIDALPEDLKKTVLEWVKKNQTKAKPTEELHEPSP